MMCVWHMQLRSLRVWQKNTKAVKCCAIEQVVHKLTSLRTTSMRNVIHRMKALRSR